VLCHREQSGGPLSSTKILSDASFDKIYGNVAPVGQDQKYSLIEKNFYFDLADLATVRNVPDRARSKHAVSRDSLRVS
jgi:hypothetical protein